LQVDRNEVNDDVNPLPITVVVVAADDDEEEEEEEDATIRMINAPVTLSMSLSVTSQRHAVTDGLPAYRYDKAPHSETQLLVCAWCVTEEEEEGEDLSLLLVALEDVVNSKGGILLNFCGIILPLEHPISIVCGANPFGDDPKNERGTLSRGMRVSPAP